MSSSKYPISVHKSLFAPSGPGATAIRIYSDTTYGQVSAWPGFSATGPFYQASAPVNTRHLLISNNSTDYQILLDSYTFATSLTTGNEQWLGAFVYSGASVSPTLITTYFVPNMGPRETNDVGFLLPPNTSLFHYNIKSPAFSSMSGNHHVLQVNYSFVKTADSNFSTPQNAFITNPGLPPPTQVKQVYVEADASGEAPAGDVTPDALYWSDMVYYMMAGEVESYEDQITGIDTTITLRPEYSQGDGLQLYYRVDNTQQSLGTLYDPPSQGFTLINSEDTFTVTNGKWITFAPYGNAAGFLAAVQILNQSDGDAVVAEFNISTSI